MTVLLCKVVFIPGKAIKLTVDVTVIEFVQKFHLVLRDSGVQIGRGL